MTPRFSSFWMLLSLGLLSACGVATPPPTAAGAGTVSPTAPHSVILLIADGMGMNHVPAVRLLSDRPDSLLKMERLPVFGAVATWNAEGRVTDSAASATALATGFKTSNGMIAMTPDSVPRRTLLEAAEERGMATGLVTTSYLTDATPAAFAAHQPSRGETVAIAAQMLRAGAELLVGGGLEHFAGGDGAPDLLAAARERGYTVEHTLSGALAAEAPLLALIPDSLLGTHAAEAELAELTAHAIELLRGDPDGFFLMVEQEETDTGSHRGELERVLRGMRSFDRAVGVASAYAARNPGVLVVVTADHETGGLTLPAGDAGPVHWTTGGHTNAYVPLYATGPQAERLAGTLDNTAVARTLAELLALRLDAPAN